MEKMDIIKVVCFIVVVLFVFDILIGKDASRIFEFLRAYSGVYHNIGPVSGSGIR